jgi:hypothetical protein
MAVIAFEFPFSCTKSIISDSMAALRSRSDLEMIADELKRMQDLILAVDQEERDDSSKTGAIWLKQARDVSYEAEDFLQQFAVQPKKNSRLRIITRVLLDGRHVAKRAKELRMKIKDVSQGRLNYHRTNSSKPTSSADTGLSPPTSKMST